MCRHDQIYTIHQSSGNVFTEPEMFMELEDLSGHTDSPSLPKWQESLDAFGWKFAGATKNTEGTGKPQWNPRGGTNSHECRGDFSWIADKQRIFLFVIDKASYSLKLGYLWLFQGDRNES